MSKVKKLKDRPVLIFDIPDIIWNEIHEMVNESRFFKDHPLSHLKEHHNLGYSEENKWNDYQCNISPYLIQKSFWFPWTLRLAETYCELLGLDNKAVKRNILLPCRNSFQHDDFYDIWTNFAYKGNKNPPHYHPPADIAGVIYYKNPSLEPTHFYDMNELKNSVQYPGNEQTMVLFPANTWHEVKEKQDDDERITIAFNLNFRTI